MTPAEQKQIAEALECPGLKQKDAEFLRQIQNSDDAWTLTLPQRKWFDDIMRRVERLRGAA